MLYPTTNPSAAEQMVVARGEGPYIYDRSGKRYLEGMAGLWCTSLGYGNEEIIETATQQMRELSFSHMFGGKTHDSAMMLADKLASMVPMKNAAGFSGEQWLGRERHTGKDDSVSRDRRPVSLSARKLSLATRVITV
jgi:adenosylmethionine-8-amino-7-oxononanoate aminotransferase